MFLPVKLRFLSTAPMDESKEEEMEEPCLCINAGFIQEPISKLKVFFFQTMEFIRGLYLNI